MSNYFKHTAQTTPSVNATELLATEVNTAFLNIENDISSETEIFNSSLPTSIGNLDTSFLKKKGFQLVTETLIFETEDKDSYLSYTPLTDNNIIIENITNPSESYTYKSSGLLTATGDFTIKGKRIIFKDKPLNELRVTYTGQAPETEDELRYNKIYLNTTDGLYPASSVTANTYRVSGDFRSACSQKVIDIINSQDQGELLKFVTIIDSDKNKLIIDSVEISNSFIQFSTVETVTSSVFVYIANTSISQLISSLYTLLYNHEHNVGEGKPVNHKDLLGLFNNTSVINYITSGKENYDHPQYFNREGYIEDPAVYNNAILGDLLLANTDSSNFYNNNQNDSNALIFGAADTGSSLKYSKSLDSLTLDARSGAQSGLSILTNADKVILGLNLHQLVDRGTLAENYLEWCISGKAELALKKKTYDITTQEFVVTDEAIISSKHVKASIIDSTSSINLLGDSSKITFGSGGGYTIGRQGISSLIVDSPETDPVLRENYKLKVKIDTTINKLTVDNLFADINISDDYTIKFSPTEELTYSNLGQVNITTVKSVNFKSSGHRTGVSLNNSIWLYTSSQTGGAIPDSVGNLYVETKGSGAVYFIQDTLGIKGEDLTRSTKLSDVFTGNCTANEFKVSYDPSLTNGISLDGTRNNEIFAGVIATGLTGLVLKSTGKIIAVSSYSPSATGQPTIQYQTIKANFEGATTGYTGSVTIPENSELLLEGIGTFKSDVTFKNNVNVEDTLKCKDIDAIDIVVQNIDVKNTLEVSKIIGADGQESEFDELRVNKMACKDGYRQNDVNGENVFSGSLRVIGDARFQSTIDMSNQGIINLSNGEDPDPGDAVSVSLLDSRTSALESDLLIKIQELFKVERLETLKRAYPIGSIYMNADNPQDPSVDNLLGFGIWARTLVGVTPFGLVDEKTHSNILQDLEDSQVKPAYLGYAQALGSVFGEYTHVITKDEMAEHRHSTAGDGSTGTESMIPRAGGSGTWSWIFTGVGRTRTPDPTFMTDGVGQSLPHNNIQRVQVVSAWKRIG